MAEVFLRYETKIEIYSISFMSIDVLNTDVTGALVTSESLKYWSTDDMRESTSSVTNRKRISS